MVRLRFGPGEECCVPSWSTPRRPSTACAGALRTTPSSTAKTRTSLLSLLFPETSRSSGKPTKAWWSAATGTLPTISLFLAVKTANTECGTSTAASSTTLSPTTMLLQASSGLPTVTISPSVLSRCSAFATKVDGLTLSISLLPALSSAFPGATTAPWLLALEAMDRLFSGTSLTARSPGLTSMLPLIPRTRSPSTTAFTR
mmetsp:Transcript_10057/g.15348  ORF Transcript_10057/g.15348 Transcript_10057/m.15348 type:complete len:201 (-) Transcript_10057:1343-1945(-)